MGEMAEDMIDGSACSECGCYFKHPNEHAIYTHGYPVLCWDCYDEEDEPELPKADVSTF